MVVTSYNLNDPLFVLKDMIYIDTKTHENVVKSIEKQGRNIYLSFDITERKRSVKLDLKED